MKIKTALVLGAAALAPLSIAWYQVVKPVDVRGYIVEVLRDTQSDRVGVIVTNDDNEQHTFYTTENTLSAAFGQNYIGKRIFTMTSLSIREGFVQWPITPILNPGN